MLSGTKLKSHLMLNGVMMILGLEEPLSKRVLDLQTLQVGESDLQWE